MSRPLLSEDDKALLPPIGSTDGVPAEQRRVPIVLEGGNGWIYYLLEGGGVDYGYEAFAIVDGFECTRERSWPNSHHPVAAGVTQHRPNSIDHCLTIDANERLVRAHSATAAPDEHRTHHRIDSSGAFAKGTGNRVSHLPDQSFEGMPLGSSC